MLGREPVSRRWRGGKGRGRFCAGKNHPFLLSLSLCLPASTNTGHLTQLYHTGQRKIGFGLVERTLSVAVVYDSLLAVCHKKGQGSAEGKKGLCVSFFLFKLGSNSLFAFHQHYLVSLSTLSVCLETGSRNSWWGVSHPRHPKTRVS